MGSGGGGYKTTETHNQELYFLSLLDKLRNGIQVRHV